jgi:tetratricopeptide (TPR) repeat protein
MFYKIFSGKFLLVFFLTVALFTFASAQQSNDESNSDNEANQNQAIETFNRGQGAHEKGDLAVAVKFYEEALKLFPDFPEAEYQRGAALVSLSNLAEAEKAFRRAIELRGDWSLAWARLGDLLVRKHGDFFGKIPNSKETLAAYDEASKVLRKAIELDANNFPAFVALTELILRSSTPPANQLSDLLLQIKYITEGKSNVPTSVWTARAALERRLGNKKASRESIERALKIEPNNVPARLERARLLAFDGDLNAAIADASLAEKSASKETIFEARLLLAQLLTENGDVANALKVINSLTATEKSSPHVFSLSNFIAANSAEGEARITALEKLLDKNQKNVAVLGRLCNYSRTVDPLRALKYCGLASELEPYHAGHAIGFGAALIQVKQFERAVELFRKILELAPSNHTARANYALALYKLNRYGEAIAEFNILIEANPSNAVAYYFLATAHDALEEYVNALAAYQKFLQLADARQNQLEIDKVKLRLPVVARQVEKGAGKKKSPKM